MLRLVVVFILTMSQKKLAIQYTRGLTPLTNCRCLACVTLSWIRYSTKLAGTKDMAKITQIATTASTEVVSLKECISKQYLHKEKNTYIKTFTCIKSSTETDLQVKQLCEVLSALHSHCDLRQLFLSQV